MAVCGFLSALVGEDSADGGASVLSQSGMDTENSSAVLGSGNSNETASGLTGSGGDLLDSSTSGSGSTPVVQLDRAGDLPGAHTIVIFLTWFAYFIAFCFISYACWNYYLIYYKVYGGHESDGAKSKGKGDTDDTGVSRSIVPNRGSNRASAARSLRMSMQRAAEVL